LNPKTANKDPFSLANLALFNKGAYQYELELANKYNFTDEYKAFAEIRVNDYFTATHRKLFSASQTYR